MEADRLPASKRCWARASGMEKNEVLHAMLDRNGLGLEIGPQARGVAPRREGFNVKNLDYISAPELRALHASNEALDKSMIEDVDYVSGGRPLGQVVPERGHFDWVIASHVIEHIPDFVGFLKDCEAIMKPEGKLVLAVPDMRLIFDAFRPLTSLGEVMDIHHRKPDRHAPGKILDYWAYVVNRDGHSIIWNPGDHGPLNLIHPIPEARRQYDAARASETYIDTHAWMFTPSSFRLLVNDIHEMGETGLREAEFSLPVPPKTYPEFYISLSRSGHGSGMSRTDLMRRTIWESREVY